PRQRLHVYRLMDSTGNLKHAPDFMAYSDAAMALGLSAEAAAVLDEGIKTKAFSEKTEQERAERYLASNNTRAEAQKAELPKLQAEAKAATTGDELVALGMAQYSFGQYAEAVQSLQAGLAKGGLKNKAD